MDITHPSFDDEELRLVKRCLDSRWVTQGPLTLEFERLFAERHHTPHALATTSCTAALHLSALALELEPGAEVVVPAFTWVTSAHCAEYVGAKAVFADIDPATFNLDPDAFEAAITPRTRAVVAVHLFGLAAPMGRILDIARRHQLAVIEDAACAAGTSYNGKPVGVLGDLGCFSFHPRKVITTGEGGMVTTSRTELADRIRSLRNHGATGPAAGADPAKPYTMSTFELLGFNLRMSDIQAAVGIAQMAKLDALLRERRNAAAIYNNLLRTLEEVMCPVSGRDDPGHAYQSYVILLRRGGRNRRNAIMEHLQQHGINTRPGTHAVHRLGYYATKYNLKAADFPRAAECEDCTITLPLFPGIAESDQKRVVEALQKGLSQTAGVHG